LSKKIEKREGQTAMYIND